MKIAYEPHPVTPDRKAALIASGYRILDAQFAPDDVEVEHNLPIADTPKPRKRRKGKGQVNGS
jgi:hypothetical protein